MTKYRATISARKEGAIGQHGTEQRVYTIETNDREQVNSLAIDAAYKEGGIEHVRVVKVEEL